MAHRIAILADVHLADADGAAAELLRHAVEKIEMLGVDRVVVLGDLLDRGTPEEYEAARKILGALADRLEPVLGNHELLSGSVADFEREWGKKPHRQFALGELPAVVLNSGIEGLPVSEWRGRIDADQLRWLAAVLEPKAESPVAVFCHHPIAGTVRRSEEPMFGLENSRELEKILSRHPHDVLLFSGHTHWQSIADAGRITCVGCPPVCFWPHAFLTVDLDGTIVKINTVRLTDSPEQSPDPHAKDEAYRLRGEGQKTDQVNTIALG